MEIAGQARTVMHRWRGGAMVARRTCDQAVAGSTPGLDAQLYEYLHLKGFQYVNDRMPSETALFDKISVTLYYWSVVTMSLSCTLYWHFYSLHDCL